MSQSTAQTLVAFTPPMPNYYPRLHQNSNHRPIKHPPKKPIQTYYCETCRITIGDHTSYQAHLNGAKHKRKELNSNTYRCELCDLTCASSDSYKSHFNGSKHQKVDQFETFLSIYHDYLLLRR